MGKRDCSIPNSCQQKLTSNQEPLTCSKLKLKSEDYITRAGVFQKPLPYWKLRIPPTTKTNPKTPTATGFCSCNCLHWPGCAKKSHQFYWTCRTLSLGTSLQAVWTLTHLIVITWQTEVTFLLFLVQVTRRKLERTSPKLWGHRPTYLEGRDAYNIINSVTDEVETQNDFTSPCSRDICVNPGTSPLQFCNSISRSDLPEKYQLSGSLISWSRTHYGRPQWSPSALFRLGTKTLRSSQKQF